MRLFHHAEKNRFASPGERTSEQHGHRVLSLLFCLCMVLSMVGVALLANAVASAAPAAVAETQTREVDVNAYPDGMTISFDVDTSTASEGWLYYWGNSDSNHHTGVEFKSGQVTAIYKKANNNPIPAGALEPGVNHHITVTYSAIPADGTSQLVMALYVDGRKIGEIPRLGSFFNETLSFTYTVPEITIENGVRNEHQIAVDAGIAPEKPVIWFDATLGNTGGNPYSAAIDRIATYDFIKDDDGNWFVKLPENAWKNASIDHDYTLAGWYDIYTKKYYQPGTTVAVNELGDENHNTVFYADWWAADYSLHDENKDAVPNGRFDRGNSFISTTVFDYNELYNVGAAAFSSDQLDESGHRETWTDQQERIAFTQYRRTSGTLLNLTGSGNINKSHGSGDSNTGFPGIITPELWEKGVKELFADQETLPLGVKRVGEGSSLYQYNRSTGYYYYDSRLNAVSYDQSNNRFHVYEQTESVDEHSEKPAFVPFNAGKDLYASNSEVNYWFGFSTEINFSLQYDVNEENITNNRVNKAECSNGASLTDMAFTFAGDDDVYVFVDDVLRLDMGGIHDVVFGEINFTNGTITYGEKGAAIANPDYYTSPGNPPTVTSGRTEHFELDSGEHTLRICYMERGAGASNCAIYFNIQPEMRQQLYKVDEDGNGVAGVEFTMYAAKEGSAYKAGYQHHEAQEFELDGSQDDARLTVVTTREGEPDPTKPSEMQDKGYADLVGENGKVIDFTDRANDGNVYYILRETGSNSAYRGLLKDVVLKFDPEFSTFEVVNQFEVGAYASFNTIMTDNQDALYFASLNENGTTKADTAYPITTTDQKDSLLFAVPLIKINNDWFPVYGSNTQGFTIVNIYSKEDYPGTDKESAAAKSWVLRHNIMATVLRQSASKVAPDWVYQFDENISRFTATFQNLPGNPRRYVANNKDDPSKADIVLAGFMVDGGSLVSLVQGIDSTADLAGMDDTEKYAALQETLNNWSDGNWATVFDERIAKDPTGRDDSWNTLKDIIDIAYREGNPETGDYAYGYNLVDITGFERYYSSVIYIPNEIRDLRIQKRDQHGNGLNGAAFSLFGSFADAVNGTNPLATGTTGKVNDTDGTLLLGFEDTDSNPLDGGFAKVNWEQLVAEKKGEGGDGRTFWIKETKAPTGYEVNPAIMQVYVGEQMIYANASGYKAEKQADGSYKPVLIDNYSGYYTNDENDKTKLEELQSGTKYNTDGVSVRSSVGKLFQSMAKYADMVVDSTLVDITARDYIFVNTTADGQTLNPEGTNKAHWSFAGENGTADKHNFNLHYWGENLDIMSTDYSTNHDAPIRANGTYASTNNGYMYLRPTQTPSIHDTGYTGTDNPFSYEGNHPAYTFSTRRTALRESDGTATDISDLFSPSTVIVVEDVKTGTLTVEKQIENADATHDPDAEFHFTVEIKTLEGKAALQEDFLSVEKIANGESAEAILPWTEVKDGEGNVTGLKAEFTLKRDEKIKISGIIYGTTYTVSEASAGGYELLDVKDGIKNESITFDKEARSTGGMIGEEPEGSEAEANAHRIFVNVPLGKLTVEKYIHDDDRWEVDKTFAFTVTLTAQEGKSLNPSALTVMKVKKAEDNSETSESIEGVWKETKDADDHVTEVTATFNLQHGERIVIGEIPYGTDYKVAESDRNGYYLEHVADNPEDEVGADGSYLELNRLDNSVRGTVTQDNNEAYLLFNNAKPAFLPFTGSFGVELFYGIGAALLFVSIVIFAVRRRKRRGDVR